MFVLKDLTESYGLNKDDIHCLEDIEPFLEWVKTNTNDHYGFKPGGYGGGLKCQADDPNYMNVATNVFAYKNDAGEYIVENAMGRDEFLACPKLYRDWYTKGCNTPIWCSPHSATWTSCLIIRILKHT